MVVLPLGVKREFVCRTPEPGYGIVWGVNGTDAASPQFQDYIDLGEKVHLEDRIQINLTFTAYARANNTHIRCLVTNIDEGESMVPDDMNCIVQGKLVGELIN